MQVKVPAGTAPGSEFLMRLPEQPAVAGGGQAAAGGGQAAAGGAYPGLGQLQRAHGGPHMQQQQPQVRHVVHAAPYRGRSHHDPLLTGAAVGTAGFLGGMLIADAFW
jgi:hypothetical protein